MTEIWTVDLARCEAGLRALEAEAQWLPSSEAAEAHSPEVLASRIALRLLIERVAGAGYRQVQIARPRHARPYVDGSDMAFSVSRAAGRALIAIDRSGPIGIDLERERHVSLSPDRQSALEGVATVLANGKPLPEPSKAWNARFLQAWVRLEAVAKADGMGIGRLLTLLGIMGSRDDPATTAATAARLIEESGLVVRDLAIGPGWYAAIASGPAAGLAQMHVLPADLAGLRSVAG